MIAAILMTGVGVWWFLSYDKMTSAWTVVPEKETISIDSDASVQTRRKGLGFALILSIAELAVFSVCNNLIKDGLTTWVPSILKDNYGLPDSWSIALSLLLPIFGLLGTVLVVKLCKITNNYILLIAGLFLCSAVLILFINELFSTSLWGVILAMFSLTSLLMHGINNVITCLGPLNMRSKINSGVLAGILNGFAYIGSMLSSYSLGKIADIRGWSGVIHFLLLICLIPIVVAMVNCIRNILKR